MVRSGLGLGPWESLAEGLANHSGLSFGTITILIGIPIVAAWWPLTVRPGIGTVSNVALVGLVTNAVMPALPVPDGILAQVVLFSIGMLAIGVGSGLYLGADLGPGPRDGLMTGLHGRFGWSIARSRTTIELPALAVGYALGGTIGIGTVIFALGIGPLIGVCMAALVPDAPSVPAIAAD